MKHHNRGAHQSRQRPLPRQSGQKSQRLEAGGWRLDQEDKKIEKIRRQEQEEQEDRKTGKEREICARSIPCPSARKQRIMQESGKRRQEEASKRYGKNQIRTKRAAENRRKEKRKKTGRSTGEVPVTKGLDNSRQPFPVKIKTRFRFDSKSNRKPRFNALPSKADPAKRQADGLHRAPDWLLHPFWCFPKSGKETGGSAHFAGC